MQISKNDEKFDKLMENRSSEIKLKLKSDWSFNKWSLIVWSVGNGFYVLTVQKHQTWKTSVKCFLVDIHCIRNFLSWILLHFQQTSCEVKNYSAYMEFLISIEKIEVQNDDFWKNLNGSLELYAQVWILCQWPDKVDQCWELKVEIRQC